MTAVVSDRWLLVDNYLPLSKRQGGEEMPLHSVSQMASLIRQLAAKEPRILIMEQPGHPLQLFIGVGGELAGIEAYPHGERAPGERPSWVAKAKRPYASEDRVFISEGWDTEFEADALIPLDDAIEILTLVMERGNLPDTHAWVNMKGEHFC